LDVGLSDDAAVDLDGFLREVVPADPVIFLDQSPAALDRREVCLVCAVVLDLELDAAKLNYVPLTKSVVLLSLEKRLAYVLG